MYNFCTLFNSHYLSRGLAMYESLLANCSGFHLYIFAFDQVALDYLTELDLQYVTVISLEHFEGPELLLVKPGRTVAEYCWTCTPSTLAYAIERFNLENCTYLDADIYFFSDPATLIEEMGSASVLITEHRYTLEYDQAATSGRFCVQFMTFHNTPEGMAVLCSWRDACIDWCFARYEEGRFGDQKYLDEWPTRFPGVHILQHLGGGLAPWNAQQYQFSLADARRIVGTAKASNRQFDAVFYHYQNFKFFGKDDVELGYYRLTTDIKRIIYKPYLQHLLRIEAAIATDPRFASVISSAVPAPRGVRWKIKLIKRQLLGYMNFHSIEQVLGL